MRLLAPVLCLFVAFAAASVDTEPMDVDSVETPKPPVMVHLRGIVPKLDTDGNQVIGDDGPQFELSPEAISIPKDVACQSLFIRASLREGFIEAQSNDINFPTFSHGVVEVGANYLTLRAEMLRNSEIDYAKLDGILTSCNILEVMQFAHLAAI